MKLEEWRSNKGLTGWLKEQLESPNGQELLRTLEESHIRHYVVPGMDAAEALGRIRGFDIAINNLVAAASYQKPQKAVPATYEKPIEE